MKLKNGNRALYYGNYIAVLLLLILNGTGS